LPLIPKLSALTHVYAIDFRGHGGSSHTPHDYTLRTHVEDIKRFIDTLIREPVFVAGHSMGASAFVIELTPEDQTKTRLDVYGPEGVQRHTRQWLEMDLTHFDSMIEGTHATGWNGKEILSHITCPTLFITDNRWTNEEAVRQMQFSLSNVKNSRHVVIDVSNHRVHEMRPNEYLDTVIQFLKPLISE
jgi:pimeloyl-ACP methyl ester carboxylesterase